MEVKRIYAAAVGLFLASCGPDTQVQAPEVRCEGLGLAEGSDDYNNCLYVLSNLDKADKSLKTNLDLKCAKGPFEFAHCMVWYTRDRVVREAIDEQAVKGFQATMEAQDDVKAKIEDRCREKIGKKSDLTNNDFYKCIVIESSAYYESLGAKSNEYYELLEDKSNEYIEFFNRYYNKGCEKSKALYEGGKDKSKEFYERWNKLPESP